MIEVGAKRTPFSYLPSTVVDEERGNGFGCLKNPIHTNETSIYPAWQKTWHKNIAR